MSPPSDFQAPDPNNRLFINISVDFPPDGDNRLVLYRVPQPFGVADLYNLDKDGVIEKISITNARSVQLPMADTQDRKHGDEQSTETNQRYTR